MTESEMPPASLAIGGWRVRVSEALISGPAPVRVLADRESGIDFAIATLGSERPLVWLRLDRHDAEDPVRQGAKLADAMARAVGRKLFGYGLPLAHAVRQVVRAHAVLGPFTIVVSGAEWLGEFADEVLELAPAGSKVILVYSSPESWSAVRQTYNAGVLDESDLSMTVEEARQLSAGRLEDSELDAFLASSSQKFLPFLQALSERRGGTPVMIPEPDGATVVGREEEEIDARVLVEALHQQGRAAEALELALRSGLMLDDDLVDAAGWEHDANGLSERLWRLLAQISPEVRHRSEVVMRWYFAAATAVNRHGEVKAEVATYLRSNDAPELRALFAGAFPDPDSLLETSRALSRLESPTTLRMHAFALSRTGKGDDCVHFLQRALRLSEALGHDSLVVACATDLADYWIGRGHYADASEWARWALDWYYSSGLSDELRRLVASALLVYTRILEGDTTALDTLVEDLVTDLAGVPTTEAIVSTRADWAYINGNPLEAQRLYSLVVERSHTGQLPHLAVDVVHGLVTVGKQREALELARRVRALTKHADPVAVAYGKLAMGIACAGTDPDLSLRLLSDAVAVLSGDTEGPRLAQCSIALAKQYLRLGREDCVRDAFRLGEPGLRELGLTGWTLLGGYDPDVKRLFQLFRGTSTEVECHFLGGERIIFHGKPLTLGLRQCECLVVLSSRPSGVTAERLGNDVYGESANMSTLKAIVSRLRQAVPVESKPYRVGVSLWADFVEIEQLISRGRVREAMTLYHGPLLPRSEAPAVVELREQIDESVRRAVLSSGDVESLIQLAKLAEDDLELYEAALEHIAPNDPRSSTIRARMEQVRRGW